MTRARPWLSLLLPPLLLAASFALTAAVLLAAGAATPETVGAALEASPMVPATLGFVLAFVVVVRWFAKPDGRSLAALGWSTPTRADVVTGVVAAIVFTPLNTLVLFPLVTAADPSFDATAARLPLWGAVLLFGSGVLAEETVYRGYALPALKERVGTMPAVLVTSLAYALLAPGPTWPPKVWAFGFGLLAAALRVWRGSLWPVALVHLSASLAPKLLAALG